MAWRTKPIEGNRDFQLASDGSESDTEQGVEPPSNYKSRREVHADFVIAHAQSPIGIQIV